MTLFFLMICSYALMMLTAGLCILNRSSKAACIMSAGSLLLSAMLFTALLILAAQFRWGNRNSFTPMV